MNRLKLETKFLNLPKLVIPYQIMKEIINIVHNVSTEVTWYLTTKKVKNTITVKDIIIPHQECNQVNTEITEEGESEMLDFQAANNVFYGVWGHSHVNMRVNPSSQDYKFFERNRKNAIASGHGYTIMMIVNKSNDISVVYGDKNIITNIEIFINNYPRNFEMPIDCIFIKPETKSYKDKVSSSIKSYLFIDEHIEA